MNDEVKDLMEKIAHRMPCAIVQLQFMQPNHWMVIVGDIYKQGVAWNSIANDPISSLQAVLQHLDTSRL